MIDRIIDRCKIICGGATEECIIDNTRHLDCIADMVVNKTSAISLLLGRAIDEERPESTNENIQNAITISNELNNWVKYLQVSRNLKHLSTLQSDVGPSQRRKVARYPLPEMYRKYILMQIALSGRIVPVSIIDFCQRGTQFECPEALELESVVECTLTTTYHMRKEVHFKTRIKYCSSKDSKYLIGAHIEEVADRLNFNFFNNIYAFITEIEK